MRQPSLIVRVVTTVLSRREKIQLVGLGAAVLLGVALEMFGLGLFVPTIGLLTRDDAIAVVRRAWQPASGWSDLTIVIGGLAILSMVFVLKTGASLAITWYQRTTMARMSVRLTSDLFERYLGQPYGFHKEANSAHLIRNVQNASLVVSDSIGAVMSLVSDGLITVGVLAVLIVVEPVATTIVVLVLGALGVVSQRFTRQRAVQLGAKRNRHQGQMILHQQQTFNAVKEIVVSGRQQAFVESHLRHVAGLHISNRTYGFLQQLPRAWMEVVTIIGLGGLIVVVVAQGRSPSDALPILGLFGVAAFRIQPSIIRMMIAVQALSYSRSVIEGFYRDFMLPVVQASNGVRVPRMSREIQLDHIGFEYGDGRTVLSSVTARIARGEKIGVIGQSGAGKSTLVDLLLGLIQPTEGRILVDGVPISGGMASWQAQIGYVPQDIFLLDATIVENVAFGLVVNGEMIDEIWRVLRTAQLEEFVRSLPDGLDSRVGERGVRLSGGQRQRIGIARALIGDPSILILDEATSALDSTTEAGVLDAIDAASRDKTVIAVAHRLTTLTNFDRIWRIEGGRLTDLGAPDDVVNRPDSGGARN